MKKKIVYVDMDNTIVNFKSGIEKLSKEDQEKFKDNLDDHPEIFALMEPIDGAIEALKELNNHFDLYILLSLIHISGPRDVEESRMPSSA